MPDIAPVRGLIELTDNFTSQLGLAEAALSHFTKENQASLTAVGAAVGLVTGTIAALAAATLELGKRGAEINDVNDTIVHFAGGATEANEAMKALRDGTKGTVDNFNLAKDAAHLLSAGVKLTADDFGTLGQAAFVLQNRGLGDTKVQMDLVSDALVTGRTRALAMELGVVEVTDAQEKYAASLGITKDQLSQAGVAEANRIAVMQMLKTAVKDAGVQERDFGEQLEAARAGIANWVDSLESAVAKSPVFAAGMKAIETAVSQAFGGDQSTLIQDIVHALEEGAVIVADFALAGVEAARVINVAWSGVKTIVLGLETAIVGVVDSVARTLTVLVDSAADAGLVSDKTKAQFNGFADSVHEVTAGLATETAEAAKGLIGHSEFDKTLDHLGGTIFQVRDAMVAAQTATTNNTSSSESATDSAKKQAAAQAELTARMIDQAKAKAALIKSSTELAGIWSDYYAQVDKDTLDSSDAQQSAIEATFDKQVAALDALDPLYNAKYKAYRATADESLSAISSDWNSVKDKSLEALQQQADAAEKTYDQMTSGSYHFSREVLDEQLQKWKDLQAQANGLGTTAQKAILDTANTVQVLDHAWVTDADIATASLSKAATMVKTLSGELISLSDAIKRQDAGGDTSVTTANFADALKQFVTDGGWTTGQDHQQYRDPYDLAKKGYSFGEITKYAFDPKQQNGPLPPPQGPRIPGFADGGIAMVGENGPEMVRLPFGSQVYPTGTAPSSTSVSNVFYVNGSAQDLVRQFKDLVMSDLKLRRLFSS